MKTIIHISSHVINKNAKKGTNDPVLTVKTYKRDTYAHEVLIKGESRLVYGADRPLPFGARVWLETEAEVEVVT